MRCRKAHWFLSARCDGTLSERQRLKLEEHLSACEACRREAFYFIEIGALATRLENCHVRPDFDLRLRVAVRRTEAEAIKTVTWRNRLSVLSLSPVMVAASILVLGLGGLGAWGVFRGESPVDLVGSEPVAPSDPDMASSIVPAGNPQQSGILVPLQGPEVIQAERRYLQPSPAYVNDVVPGQTNNPESTTQEFILPTVTPGQEPRSPY